MKKITFSILVLFSLSAIGFSQSTWTGGTGLLYANPATTTKVGIGVASPLARLQVNSATSEVPLLVQINGVEKLRLATTGFVGIGTNTPGALLEIKGTYSTLLNGGTINFTRTDGPSYLYAQNAGGYLAFVTNGRTVGAANSNLVLNTDLSSYFNGNLGIGTTTPRGALDVTTGNVWLTASGTAATNDLYAPGHVYFIPRSGSNIAYLQSRRSDNTGPTEMQLRTYTSAGIANEAIRINSSGFVGIGTTNPSCMLTVNGNIKAERVDIIADVPASDYVFEEEYNLRSLTEVESFVTENKHLPEVPSASEFKENGYSVAQMDDLLLRKVEELTLYIIEQQKLIEQLQTKVEQLEGN